MKVDTLMRYNFQFFIDITSEVAIKRGSRRLASIGFEGTLSGMAPWKLTGKAKLKILFIKVTMPVYLQLGMATQIVIDAIDAQIPLLDALHDPGNWSSLDDDSGVVLLDIKREGVWMPSHSSIKVSQRVVPLDEKISRFGPSPLHEPQEFKIKSVLLGENHEQGQSNWQPVYEEFAPVLFEEIDLDESLKAPSFEKMQSGIHLSGDAVSKGASVDSGSDFEKIIIDDEYDESADEEMEKSGITISMSTVSAGEDVQVQDEYDFYRVARQPVGVESPKYTIADDELARDKDASSEGMNYFKARQERIKAQTKGIRRQVVRRYEVIR